MIQRKTISMMIGFFNFFLLFMLENKVSHHTVHAADLNQKKEFSSNQVMEKNDSDLKIEEIKNIVAEIREIVNDSTKKAGMIWGRLNEKMNNQKDYVKDSESEILKDLLKAHYYEAMLIQDAIKLSFGDSPGKLYKDPKYTNNFDYGVCVKFSTENLIKNPNINDPTKTKDFMDYLNIHKTGLMETCLNAYKSLENRVNAWIENEEKIRLHIKDKDDTALQWARQQEWIKSFVRQQNLKFNEPRLRVLSIKKLADALDIEDNMPKDIDKQIKYNSNKKY